MSFGFSVGDFLTAAALIEHAVSALREAGGSSFQYQRVTLELHTLNRTLQEVDRLEAADGLEATVEAIKATALSCQLPLREFLESIHKYGKSLGPCETAGIMKDVLRKIKWAASKKLEAAMKLHAQITAYLGGINLLLGLYQVKLNALAERRARVRFENLNTTLASMQIHCRAIVENVQVVREQVEEGTRMVRDDIESSSRETSLALQTFQQNCIVTVADFLKNVGTLSKVTFQTYSKVAEMYNILVAIRSQLLQPDTRHTFFQEPIRFEDAYGRVWPIPVEYDYFMMEGVLRGKFQSGRGKLLVERDQWQLFESTHMQNLISAKNWEPIPGMRITMAIVIPEKVGDELACPKPNCFSGSYKDALGGGKICSLCGMWFDNVLQAPASAQRFKEVNDSNEYEDSQATHADKERTRITEKARLDLDPEDDSLLERPLRISSDDLEFLKHARVRPLRISAISIWKYVLLSSLARMAEREASFRCGESDLVTRAARKLSHSAARLLREIRRPDSRLNSLWTSWAMEQLITTCISNLELLCKILNDLDTFESSDVSRTLLSGQDCSNAAFHDKVILNHVLKKLSTHNTLINVMCTSNLRQNPPGPAGRRLASDRALKQLVTTTNLCMAEIVSEQREGSVITTEDLEDLEDLEDTGEVTWSVLRYNLLRDGCTSALVDVYGDIIKQYVIELGAMGIFDENFDET